MFGSKAQVSSSEDRPSEGRLAAPAKASPAGVPWCVRPLHELHALRLAGEVSTLEVARAVLRQSERWEAALGAFIHRCAAEEVERRAAEVDRALADGKEIGPLAGFPLALKDIFSTEGVPTTCGSAMLKGYIPPYDATVVRRLRAAGLNLVGKTNMDEFAMGSSTEHSAFGVTRNPWDRGRVAGGSSGGSAVAVASGQALAAIGTDTGGSIRQPAAFNGIVGLKPTYGRVSRYGMVAYASSFDQAGPMTRDVRDAALVLQCLAGHDPQDMTSSERVTDAYPSFCGRDPRGLRVGVWPDSPLDAETKASFAGACATLERLGMSLLEIELPHLRYATAAYYLLAAAEASSNLGRYDGVRYGLRVENVVSGNVASGEAASGTVNSLEALYTASRQAGLGEEVKRRILLGTFALSAGYHDAYYRRAQRIRACLRADFARAFARVDLIALPTTPTAAFPLGEKLDPLQMYQVDLFTLPANLVGIPGISVPAGLDSQRLPLGLQLLAKPFDEGRLIQAAHAFEQNHPGGLPSLPWTLTEDAPADAPVSI